MIPVKNRIIIRTLSQATIRGLLLIIIKMKNFKISIAIVIGIICLNQIVSQTAYAQNTDPFCQMVRTHYFIDVWKFNSTVLKKNIFETDTTERKAEISLVKKGNKISFLYINPENEEKELLYYNDTAWLADHNREQLVCMGTQVMDITHNHNSEFFSFTIFNIDTLIEKMDPFWQVISQTDSSMIISARMKPEGDDISDVRAEYEIGKTDHLLYRTIQAATYMKADQIYQEQIFSNYTFPEPSAIIVPEYYSVYTKDLGRFNKPDSLEKPEPISSPGDVFLEQINLTDLKGNDFQLPSEGLLFFDLWYVGCAPCMKSAPVVDELYHDYKDKVYFFSVNEVDKDTARISLFCNKMGISFPVLLGGKDKMAPRVSNNGGYPVFFLLDAETGKVLWSTTGYSEDLRTEIEEAILRFL